MAAPLNRAEFAEKFPAIEEGSSQPENKAIVCPFHRMLERAGLYNKEVGMGGRLLVSISKITTLAKQWGCAIKECGLVATAVSAGQVTNLSTNPGFANLGALHRALGVSHECGFTFAKGGSVVSDEQRATSLSRLEDLADSEGRLTFDNLNTVKKQICEEQGEVNTFASQVEVKLIYSFLGGKDRGFVDYDDVVRFFHAELPKTISAPSGL